MTETQGSGKQHEKKTTQKQKIIEKYRNVGEYAAEAARRGLREKPEVQKNIDDMLKELRNEINRQG